MQHETCHPILDVLVGVESALRAPVGVCRARVVCWLCVRSVGAIVFSFGKYS